jgi:hypothetical protein
MTRDEAIELRLRFGSGEEITTQGLARSRKKAANDVDFCVAAGILKLDEPKIPSRMLVAIECELSRQYDTIRSIKELDMCNPTAVRIGGMIDLEALAAAVELPAGEVLPPFYGTTRNEKQKPAPPRPESSKPFPR